MFKFETYDIAECEQINLPGKRLYKTPEGNMYPSVTTVLGSIPNPELEKWKQRVGEETAAKISKAASDRGTLIHGWAEAYLKTWATQASITQNIAWRMFSNMVPYLSKVEIVHALEQRLWSDKLRVAGTVDLIAQIGGSKYIIDFKTSNSYKSKEDIDSYFMQAACYSVMWYERTGMAISKCKIWITCEEPEILLEYEEDLKPWIIKFREVRDNYDRCN